MNKERIYILRGIDTLLYFCKIEFNHLNQLTRITHNGETLLQIGFNEEGELNYYRDNKGGWWDDKCPYPFPYGMIFQYMDIQDVKDDTRVNMGYEITVDPEEHHKKFSQLEGSTHKKKRTLDVENLLHKLMHETLSFAINMGVEIDGGIKSQCVVALKDKKNFHMEKIFMGDINQMTFIGYVNIPKKKG